MVCSRNPVCLLLALCLLPGLRPDQARGESPNIPEHPLVAGFERFHTEPSSDPIRGGLILLGELNCTSCHRSNSDVAMQILPKRAPILDGVGGRVKTDYLRAYLANPNATKPGTTMPHALVGMAEPDRADAVDNLVHFLATTGAVLDSQVDRRAVSRGRDLFRQVGCMACHGDVEAAGRLATSVPLPDLARKYTASSLAGFLLDPHAVRPSGRMPSLNLESREGAAIAAYLLRDQAGEFPPNVAYRAYVGQWLKMPDLDALTPKSTGEAVGLDLRVARQRNNFALRFEGYFRVQREEEYTFSTTSDDGSQLWVDGQMVVDNDGVHPDQEQSGKVRLQPGAHKLVVAYFDGGGERSLEAEFRTPTLAQQSIEPMLALTQEATLRNAKEQLAVDPARVEKGRGLFASLGCASCHALKQDGGPILSSKTGGGLEALKADAGCLAPKPPTSAMDYSLNDRQRTALKAAIGWLAAGPKPPAVPESIARAMTTFNCYACHARDGQGGVEEARNPWFEATYADLGDEGRLPPHLTGAGAKLTGEWLSHIMRDGAKDRPYMKARMPKFGGDNVGYLGKDFAEADPLPRAEVVTLDMPDRKVKGIGRNLIGTQAFGCVQCHNFRGEKSAGIPALDMSIMTKRVRHDWFVKYVVNPQAYRPGTRMPSSWPEPASQIDVLGASSPKQIESVWSYLSDGESAAFPYGIGREPIPLVATSEPVLYRNFIRGGGARAIGVGYPDKANIAFDANAGRIAMIWQGGFMDASRHWIGRGEGFQPPMGDNIVDLPTGPSFARLANPEEPWPIVAGSYHFRGYQLDAKRFPTFRYEFDSVAVEDRPEPVPGKEAAGLSRKLVVKTPDAANDLYFRAAQGSVIEPGRDGSYRVDKTYAVRIKSGTPPVLRTSQGRMELLVPVRPINGSATLTQEFTW